MTEQELYNYNKDTREDFEKILYDNSEKVLPSDKKTLNDLTETLGGSLGELFDNSKTYDIGDIVSDSNLDVYTSLTVNTGKEPRLNKSDWELMKTSSLENGEIEINATAVIYLRLSNTYDPATVLTNIASISRIDRNNVEVFFHPDAKISNDEYTMYGLIDNTTTNNVRSYFSIYDRTTTSFKVNLTRESDNPEGYSTDYVRLYLVIVK